MTEPVPDLETIATRALEEFDESKVASRTRRSGIDQAGEPGGSHLRPHPHPSCPGGLPDSWTPIATLPEWMPEKDLCLARRADRGWVLLEHDRALGSTRVRWIDETLGHMYASVRAETEQGNEKGLEETNAWIAEVLESMFDDDDPTERAERVMFALSGVVRHLPRRAA